MNRASIAVVAGLLAALLAAVAPVQAQVKRPNIVIILGDDLGFADMGAFGSEIKTPNLDGLAKEGVRFANFYTHASCSPTRSILLSGVDTHLNGLGNMDEWTAPNQWGVDGYEGVLNNRVVTLPQLLRDAGYHTYMAGMFALAIGVSLLLGWRAAAYVVEAVFVAAVAALIFGGFCLGSFVFPLLRGRAPFAKRTLP